MYATMDAVTQPALGDATPPPPGQCSYEHQDGTTCGQPAAWHGLALDDTGTEVNGLESCDNSEHLAVMADVTKWIHPWADACAEGWFDVAANRCVKGT